MSDPANSQSRRRFLKTAVLATSAGTLLGYQTGGRVLAADLPHVDPADPTAKALGYTEDASTAGANPTYKPGSQCSACQFFQGGATDEYGPCMIFPGKAVHAKGWCASFNKKA